VRHLTQISGFYLVWLRLSKTGACFEGGADAELERSTVDSRNVIDQDRPIDLVVIVPIRPGNADLYHGDTGPLPPTADRAEYKRPACSISILQFLSRF
jgi:hypothetical protein